MRYHAGAGHEAADAFGSGGGAALQSPPGSEVAHDLGPLVPGPGITSTISVAEETDTVTVNLVFGQTYVFSLIGSGETALEDPYLTITGPGGTNLVDDDGGNGINSLLTFAPPTSGTYTLTIQGYPGAGVTGGYTIQMAQRASDNVPDTIGGNPVLAEGTTLGFFESPSDVDIYTVTIEADTLYAFRVAGGTDYNTPTYPPPAGEADTVIEILDAAGNIVYSNDDVASQDYSSAVQFLAETGGTYYVRVYALNGSSGGYALEMEATDISELSPLTSIDWGSTLPSTNVSVYFAAAGETFDGVTSEGWSVAEQTATMAALQTWADVTNLVFTTTTNAATATFRLVTSDDRIDALGYMNPPGEDNAGVGVFNIHDPAWTNAGALSVGGQAFYTLVHEFGHGLGLAHPHDTGGTSDVMVGVEGAFDSYGLYDLNQGVYTIMSYNSTWALHPAAAGGAVPGNPNNYGFQAGPGAFDIAVLQARYGVDTARNNGNNVYTLPTTNGTGTYYSTIWDTGGTDTIIQNGAASARIDLTAATLDYTSTGGGVVSYADGIFGGFTIANGVVIENATGGGGADSLIGNAAANRLDGRGGADTMIGRAGNDTYVVDNAGDAIVEAADEGTDTVESSVSHTLGANLERLTLTGSANINGTGNALVNLILGNSGANTLNGLAGADEMRGGAGNDRYIVDNAGDVVVELDGQGTDRVESSVSYSIAGQFIETLQLTGAAAINATGNTLNNTLIGNANANTLNGGTGADTMQGGNGDDIYFVDNAGDTVIEANGGGSDTINASVTVTLAGQYVEVVNLTGAAAINATGNGLGNRLVGNSANNVLYGMDGNDRLDGGAGADTMRGGLGNDVFVVDNAGDTVQENTGEGTDTVEAYISYSLVGQFIESLKLMGTANLNATGNGQVNELIGNSGNNILNGQGGADTMRGGAGDDRYIVDNAGDQAIELNGEGYDTVESSITFSLAGQYTDALVLTGSANINGTGNSLGNVLNGNSGNNLLRGEGGHDTIFGGLGTDTLLGGAGSDVFWFDTALGATNVDTIGDYSVTEDIIYLDRTIFTGIAADGALAAGAFRAGTAAADADDRILYDAATGNIWYDRDGVGGTAAVLFAKVTAGLALNAGDFFATP